MQSLINILLIVEEVSIATFLICSLEKKGHKVNCLIVGNAPDLLYQLKNGSLDIVIAANCIHSFEGIEAFEIVKAHDADLPFLLIADSDVEEIKNAIKDQSNKGLVTNNNLTRLGTLIKKELKYAVEKKERKLLDKALNEISTAVINNGIDEFLQTVTLQLTNSLKADYCIIGEYKQNNGVTEEIETLCFCVDGKLAENISYSIKGSPCENLLANKTCTYPENVAALFPFDEFLQIESIQGYIGIPLLNYGGKAFGIIALLYKSPIQNAGIKEKILHYYSTRIASEIERSQSQKALKESQQRFSAIFKSSPVGISLISIKDGVFRDANDSLLNRIGYLREEVIGNTTQTLNLYKNIDDRKAFYEAITKYGAIQNLECEFIEKNGESFHSMVSASIVNIDGEAFILSSIIDVNESKIAQEKLKQSETKVAAYFNSTSEAIVMLGINQGIIGFNKKYENYIWQLFNKQPVVGDNILQYMHQQDKNHFITLFSNALAGETSVLDVVVPFPKASRWLSITNVPLKNSANQIIGVAINHLDINEKIIATQNLADSEDKLSAYFNSTSETILLIAPDYTIFAFNKVCESVIWTLLKKQIAIGDSVLEYSDPASVADFKLHFSKALAGETIKTEREVTYPGNVSWYRVTYTPIKTKTDQIIGVAFSTTNITEKKLSESILVEREEKFRSMVHNIADIISLVDENGNILYQSASILPILGYQQDEIVGRNIFEFLPEKDIPFITSELEATLARMGNGPFFEFRFLNKQGVYIEMETKANNQLANPAIKAIIVNSRDISSRKKTEEILIKQAHDLETSNIELERFAFVASHDLQEPLRMVTSFMELLQKKYQSQLDETANKYINFAVEGSKRMKELITDLLHYSQIGVNEKKSESIDLNIAAAAIQMLLQDKIALTGTTFFVDNLPTVIAVKFAIDQLFQNLITNAIKYQPTGNKPIIHISGVERENDWLISIKDNGIGISSSYKDKIFVVFQRLHNKDAYAGTGIGLSICKKVIDKAGGKIWMESEEGNGTTFFFTIVKPLKN